MKSHALLQVQSDEMSRLILELADTKAELAEKEGQRVRLKNELDYALWKIDGLVAEITELKSPAISAVPEKRIDDSDYSTGWNDCRAWVIQSNYTAPDSATSAGGEE